MHRDWNILEMDNFYPVKRYKEIWLAEKSDGAMLQMAGSMPEQEVAETN